MEYKRISWRMWMQSALLIAAIGATGCEPMATGRAGAGEGYTRYVSSLYNEPTVNHGPRTIEFPVNVAVAQVGQPAPYQGLMDKLRAAPEFHRVGSLPAEVSGNGTDPNSPAMRDLLPRLQSMARDQGADYVLIFGTSVETHTRVNQLAVLDLTIVGAFVVPSRVVEADARASAAMIDVRSGTIVLTTAGQASKTLPSTAATSYTDEDIVRGIAAENSLLNLADILVADAKRRTADENATAAK